MPWVLAAAVVGAAVWAAVTMIGGGADGVVPQVASTATPTATPTPSPTPTPTPTAAPEETQSPRPEAPSVSYDGTTVQVLNGTGGVTGAAERMADRLATLGFEVIAIDDALGNFNRTIVYWTSSDSRPQAEALASANGWIVRPKPDNLSPTVAVHVIVGLDEA